MAGNTSEPRPAKALEPEVLAKVDYDHVHAAIEDMLARQLHDDHSSETEPPSTPALPVRTPPRPRPVAPAKTAPTLQQPELNATNHPGDELQPDETLSFIETTLVSEQSTGYEAPQNDTNDTLAVIADTTEVADSDLTEAATLPEPTDTESLTTALAMIVEAAMPVDGQQIADAETVPDQVTVHRAEVIVPDAPPEVQALNAQIVAGLEIVGLEQTEHVQLVLAEIVTSMQQIEQLVAAAAAEPLSPENVEQIAELESVMLETCRELLIELGIEASDDVIKSFMRHVTLTHALEAMQQSTATDTKLFDEGTHESKYFGRYMWQRLKYFLRRRLPNQLRLLGRYAVALHQTEAV